MEGGGGREGGRRGGLGYVFSDLLEWTIEKLKGKEEGRREEEEDATRPGGQFGSSL